MDNTKLYLCFEATDVNTVPVYLMYSTELSNLIWKLYETKPRPKFTLETSIIGASSMCCGLLDSKIVLAGGLFVDGEKREYNRKLITYNAVTKEVSDDEIPQMRGRKVRPLVFEVYGRLYVLDTSSCVYKRSFEIYYPEYMIWDKLFDRYCDRYFVASGCKGISGTTPYSWFVSGNTVCISSPTSNTTEFHHAKENFKGFTDEHQPRLPFQGIATTYWLPDFSDVVVLSFSEGLVQGQLLKYGLCCLKDSVTIFTTDSYEKPNGEISSYFADCGQGRFCLTTFDNLNRHIYIFTIVWHKHEHVALYLVLEELHKHKYSFKDITSSGTKSVSSISGCFVL